MKKTILTITTLAMILTATAAFAADGVMNMDAVCANYPAFRQAQQKIAQLAQDTDAKLKKEKDAAKQQQLQQEFIAQQQKIIVPVFENIKAATAKVAKAKKLGMVHAAATTFYGGVDITNDVIAALK